MKVLLDESVYLDYGQLTLEWYPNTWDGEDERFFADQLSGWVGAAVPNSVYVVLSRPSGGSAVQIELPDLTPELDPKSDDFVEVTIEVPAGKKAGASLPPGVYRLQVSARGRKAGHDGEFEDAVGDWDVLQAWPAPRAADAVLRSTCRDARCWNATCSSRRTR